MSEDLIILTNDPSMTAWGWAIVNGKSKVLDSGCIKTAPENKKRRIRKGDDNTRRVSEINQELLRVISRYKVNYLLAELPHGSQSASGAFMLGVVTGVIQTISDCLDIPVEWYSEADSKKQTLGKHQNTTKTEMVVEIERLYPNSWRRGIKFRDEAVADALSIHNTAIHQSSILKFWKNK